MSGRIPSDAYTRESKVRVNKRILGTRSRRPATTFNGGCGREQGELRAPRSSAYLEYQTCLLHPSRIPRPLQLSLHSLILVALGSSMVPKRGRLHRTVLIACLPPPFKVHNLHVHLILKAMHHRLQISEGKRSNQQLKILRPPSQFRI